MRNTVRLSGAIVLACLTVSAFAEPSPEAVKLYEAGLAAKKAGNLDAATDSLLKAVELDKTYVDAHWALAWVYVAKDGKDAAGKHFNEVIRLAPDTGKAKEATAALRRMEMEVEPPAKPADPAPPAA